jgi:hypothetical protein
VQGIMLVAASVRGRLHAHLGQWREDAFALGAFGDWAIACIADGAGSSRLARVGANLAADEALGELRKGFDTTSLCDRLTDALRAARKALEREAGARDCELRDLSTTLLLIAFRRTRDCDYLGWIGIGDGLIALKNRAGICGVVSDEDHGAFAGETRFLTTGEFEACLTGRARCKEFPSRIGAVMLATDGVSDDFFPTHRRVAELFEADSIAGMTDVAGLPLRGLLPSLSEGEAPLAESLMRWLTYEARGSDDDRTLALLLMTESNGDRAPD